MKKENLLQDNIGSIELLDFMGGDLASVNGARASYGLRKSELNEKDNRLIERLGEDIHQTPLRHTYFQLYVEAPEFIARQWFKHQVGCEFSFKDLPWSEFSQRYKEVEPKFYVPQKYRKQSTNNKQASKDEEILASYFARELYEDATSRSSGNYQELLARQLSREQARGVLPLCTYTSFQWTASIQAVVHFCVLREEAGAQWEIQQYAKALHELCEPIAPHTFKSLYDNHPLILKKRLAHCEAELQFERDRFTSYESKTDKTE